MQNNTNPIQNKTINKNIKSVEHNRLNLVSQILHFVCDMCVELGGKSNN